MGLAQEGRTATEVARLIGVPRSTVRDWLRGAIPRSARGSTDGECEQCGGAGHDFAALPREYMYLLGLYLGDGCISAHPRGVYRLRIFRDAAYPGIIRACEPRYRSSFPTTESRD